MLKHCLDGAKELFAVLSVRVVLDFCSLHHPPLVLHAVESSLGLSLKLFEAVPFSG